MINKPKLRRKKEKIEKLEFVIRDFQKNKSKYDHPESNKFNRFNKKFYELIGLANELKEQGNIQQAIRKYKEAINWAGAIVDLHKHIENKRTDSQYYKTRNRLWILTCILLILAFGLLPFGVFFDITWFVIGIFTALMIVASLVMCNSLKTRKDE